MNNKLINRVHLLTILIVSAYFVTLWSDSRVTTFISPRSQTINGARQLAYFQQQINDELNLNATSRYERPRVAIHVTPGATRSYWPEHINRCLFWPECQETRASFKVVGSRVQNRALSDWLADYFGLPTDFQSMIITCPRVKNFQIDFNGFINADAIFPGLYVGFIMPVVHTNWDMKLSETIQNTGKQNYDAGYFTPTVTDRPQLLNSMSEFITGCAAPTLDGVQFQRLSNAKISTCALKKSGIAEIQTTIGYQAYQPMTGYEFFVNFNIPGGNKPQGEFLFEPMIGNGHHWEIGLGLAGYWQPWFASDSTQKATFYAHAHINHLFATRQVRTFDLKNKPLSRYMLAAQLRPASPTNTLAGQSKTDSIPADALFNNVYAPIANLTTFPVSVHTAWQGEITLMFEYAHNNWSWLVGYNFWARSAEKICRDCCTPFDGQLWVLKGDEHLFGFADNNPSALSASQSAATINAGRNFGARGIKRETQIPNGRRNPGIDNPLPAVIHNDIPLTATPDGDSIADRINTSIQPNILTSGDIDLNSACTTGLSNTIFGQFQRTWHVKTPYVPFLAIGAQVEFGPTGVRTHDHKIPIQLNCALAHWGVWAKIGFSYQ